MTEEVISILASHGLSIDDLSQVRIVNPEAADATRKASFSALNSIKFRDVEDEQR